MLQVAIIAGILFTLVIAGVYFLFARNKESGAASEYEEWRSKLTNRQQGWLGKNIDEDVVKVLVELEQRIYLLERAERTEQKGGAK